MNKIQNTIGGIAYAAGQYDRAAKLFHELITSKEFAPFLTNSAYEYWD